MMRRHAFQVLSKDFALTQFFGPPIRWGAILAFLACLSGYLATVNLVVNQWVLPSDGVRVATYSVKIERRVGFKTFDGIVLRADIHHPISVTKTPTILVRIPFTKTIVSGLNILVQHRYPGRFRNQGVAHGPVSTSEPHGT